MTEPLCTKRTCARIAHPIVRNNPDIAEQVQSSHIQQLVCRLLCRPHQQLVLGRRLCAEDICGKTLFAAYEPICSTQNPVGTSLYIDTHTLFFVPSQSSPMGSVGDADLISSIFKERTPRRKIAYGMSLAENQLEEHSYRQPFGASHPASRLQHIGKIHIVGEHFPKDFLRLGDMPHGKSRSTVSRTYLLKQHG